MKTEKIDMSELESQSLITSKEILEKTGISRATLNNYIKMGLIPRPLVRRPGKEFRNIKSIGYFPRTVLDRIEEVKKLKREGKSMDVIVGILRDLKEYEHDGDTRNGTMLQDDISEVNERSPKKEAYGAKLKLTLDDFPFPAYLIDFDFEIVWINQKAEEKILNQKVDPIKDKDSRNIFKLLFNWEFHCHTKNWKDFVAYHISFVRFKFSKTWLARLYKGISGKEVRLLEKMYDDALIYNNQAIKDTHINFLKKDGSTDQYRVYSIFFKEGILFVYVPVDELFGGINRG
ncbi:hypothetical protein ACFL7M_12085 [Thermodesulfobacteriota bacterium]